MAKPAPVAPAGPHGVALLRRRFSRELSRLLKRFFLRIFTFDMIFGQFQYAAFAYADYDRGVIRAAVCVIYRISRPLAEKQVVKAYVAPLNTRRTAGDALLDEIKLSLSYRIIVFCWEVVR